MTWWESWFGEEYLDLYPHRDVDSARREAAFALAHLPARRAPLLDLCCGPGRHSVPFAEAGLPPIGLDYSAPLLHLARRRDPRLGLVRGEMRALPFPDGTFAAVVNFFTSFGYFLRESENVAVVAEIERVLRPGGAFLCDTFARDWVLETARPRGTPMLRRKGVHDPPFLEPRDAAHREGDRGSSRGVDRDLPRKRAGVRGGRARHALLPRRASRRGDLGRLRRIAGRARFASPHRSRAPTGVDQQQRKPFVIPFSKYPGLSPLFHDFLAGLPEFFPDPPTLDAAAERGRELLAKGARARVPASAFRHRGQGSREAWPRTSPRAAPSRFRPASRSASSRARLSP